MVCLDEFLHTRTLLPCTLFLRECTDMRLRHIWIEAVRDAIAPVPALAEQLSACVRDLSTLDEHGVQPICDPARTRGIYELANGTAAHRILIQDLIDSETDPLAKAHVTLLFDVLVTRFPKDGHRARTCVELIQLFIRSDV